MFEYVHVDEHEHVHVGSCRVTTLVGLASLP